jgi:DNA transposition AAA+ family ATPase
MSKGHTVATPAVPAFIETKEYRRFAEFCDAVRRYRYIGLCYGPPGVGKTLSARHYARWDLLEPALDAVSLTRAAATLPEAVLDCQTVVYTPGVENTPRTVAGDIRGLCSEAEFTVMVVEERGVEDVDTLPPPKRTELVLIDEADRLRTQSLEQVRALYDEGRYGVVLIGMPGIEKRLARYPQLYSRVGFVHPFRTLGAEEVTFVLTHHWEQLGLRLSPDDFTDAEALAAIIRITGGNFRLLHRLLTQVERILRINELRTVTKEVVEAAREGLVIGLL